MSSKKLEHLKIFLGWPMAQIKAGKEDLQLASRLKELRVILFGPRGQNKMAQDLGLAQPIYNHYECARVRLPHRVMALLAEKKKINPLWLLTGKGNRFLNGGERAFVVAEAEAAYGKGAVQVPVFESVGAGSPREVLEHSPDRYIYIDREFAKGEIKCARVEGDSMKPEIPNGSIVGINTAPCAAQSLQDGGIYALWAREGGVVLRRLRRHGKDLCFLPDNPAGGQPYIYTHKDRESPIIQGRVEWVLQELNP